MNANIRIAVAAVLSVFAVGCASSQLGKVTAEKEQLLARVHEQKQLNEQLTLRLLTASERLAEAERDLALADSGQPSRKPASASLTSAKTTTEAASDLSLEQLAKRESLLHYDSLHRTARIGIALHFDGDNRLTMEARRELGKAADLLASPAAFRYGAQIRGLEAKSNDPQALARANAVADYLKLRCVTSDRLAVSTRAAQSRVDEDGRQVEGQPGGVEIDLVELGGSVAKDGWTSSDRR